MMLKKTGAISITENQIIRMIVITMFSILERKKMSETCCRNCFNAKTTYRADGLARGIISLECTSCGHKYIVKNVTMVGSLTPVKAKEGRR